jgi:hypothetical protein
MTDREALLTIARARAEQQQAHISDTIRTVLLPDARRAVEEHGPIDAWAVLVKRLYDQLADRQTFLAEMLAVMAVEAVTQS